MANRAGILAAVILSGVAAAQQQSGTPPHLLQDNQRLDRVIFFSGQVQLGEGGPPPEPVAMNRVCNGQSHFLTWTDSKGRFSFQVGTNGQNSAQADASENHMPPAALAASPSPMTDYSKSAVGEVRNCELQAVLAGYLAPPLRFQVTSSFDDGRLGVITLHPLSRATALTVSATTLAAPPIARKAYEKGLDALAKQKWQSAAEEFGKAVTAYPAFAAAWYQLGVLRMKGNDAAGAIDAWKHAVASDPKYVRPYENLTAASDFNRDWASAETYSRAWIQLDPDDFPAAYLYNAIANIRLNRTGAAEAAARDGLRIDKEHRAPRLDLMLALILTGRAEKAEAAKYFREYLAIAPNASEAAAVRQQLSLLDAAAAATPK